MAGMDGAVRLFVIRHGETAWTRERRFAGATDIPLLESGRRQCEAVARALSPLPVAAVWSSPLARARQSAELIAAPHGRPVVVHPDFREMGFGAWEGLTRDEVAARYPSEWETWRRTPERFAAPGGEPLGAVAARVARGLTALREAHAGGTVILVTHAIVARLIVLEALGLGPERLWALDAAPASISEVEYRGDWVTVHRVNTQVPVDGVGG